MTWGQVCIFGWTKHKGLCGILHEEYGDEKTQNCLLLHVTFQGLTCKKWAGKDKGEIIELFFWWIYLAWAPTCLFSHFPKMHDIEVWHSFTWNHLLTVSKYNVSYYIWLFRGILHWEGAMLKLKKLLTMCTPLWGGENDDDDEGLPLK